MDKLFVYKIIQPCYQNANEHEGTDADFYLEEDLWNDFGYYTTYHLHATKCLLGGDVNEYIGALRIMVHDQAPYENAMLRTHLHLSKFTTLKDKPIVSLSVSLDFFKSISEVLTKPADRLRVMSDLRMITSKDELDKCPYASEECFQKSLLRDFDIYILKRARQYLNLEGKRHELEETKFSIKYWNVSEPLVINFKVECKTKQIKNYPRNMAAFIGHNGCGKSTYMYLLAKALYATPAQRKLLTKVNIDPQNIGIEKLIMFSYSAFDNFKLPGSEQDYAKIKQGIDSRKGRFIYCGLRDVSKEYGILLEKIKNEVEISKSDQVCDEEYVPLEEVCCKPIETLASEFVDVLLSFSTQSKKAQIWNLMINKAQAILPSLHKDIVDFNSSQGTKESYMEAYMKRSTGIKFFLHSMANLIDLLEDNSMVIYDEPENHLHPPFLSFMIQEIRHITQNAHSIVLIATHSPVILQEMFSKNIYVIRRDECNATITHPIIETYGETFGRINNEVFDITSTLTNYYNVIDQLFMKGYLIEFSDISSMLAYFRPYIGENISGQILVYLINKLYQQNKCGN